MKRIFSSRVDELIWKIRIGEEMLIKQIYCNACMKP